MTPLETRLTDALAADAARFDELRERLPADPDAADEDMLQLRQLGQPLPHRGRRVLSAVAAVAVVCLGVAAFLTLRDDDDSLVSDSGSVPSTAAPLLVVPPGEERPLKEVATDAEIAITFLAKPGSVHTFSESGHPDILLWTTVQLDFQTGNVEEWQCVSEQGSSGCGSVSIPAQFGQTSSIDNGYATDDLFTWSNLPPEVAYVRYDDGDQMLWQRPIAGLSIFHVDPDHPHPDIGAYDSAGVLLPYSFWGDNSPPSTTTDPGGSVNVQPIDPAAWDELNNLARSSVHDCLADNGANFDSPNVPMFDADEAAAPIWSMCVAKARSEVAARLAELAAAG
jgi:hypothetical protein